MCFKEFSILELERRVEEIESIEKKIEFISDEMLRCEKVIQDLEFDINETIPFEIKFIIKQNRTMPPVIEFVNSSIEIKNVVRGNIIKTCKEELCKRNNHFLDRAKLLREHYKLKFDLNIKSNGIQSSSLKTKKVINYADKIVWMRGKEKLLALFDALYKNEIIPDYTTEEILSHFADDKQIPFCTAGYNSKRFCWKDSDCRFAVLIDELAKHGIIKDDNKFKMFIAHFVNNRNKEFKGLAQKRSYTDNYTKAGSLIREILNSIGLIP